MRRLLMIAVLLMLATPVLAQEDKPKDRDVTTVERAYVGFALDQKNPEICARIGTSALEVDRLQPPGKQVYYMRSACYMYLAQMELKPEYCENVKQANNAFLAAGWHFKKTTCEKLAKSEKPVMIAYAIDHKIIMRSMGYTDGELKGRSWAQFYNDVRGNSKEMASRIQRMPDFNQLVYEESPQ